MGMIYTQNERIIDIADRFVRAFETLVYSRTENANKVNSVKDIQNHYHKFAAENAVMLNDVSVSGILSNDTYKMIKNIADESIDEVLSVLADLEE